MGGGGGGGRGPAKMGSVKQECAVQVICSRDVEAVLIKSCCAQTILSLYKKNQTD